MKKSDVKKLGSYQPNGFSSGTVVDPSGIAPTFMENHGSVAAVLIDDKQDESVFTDTEKELFTEDGNIKRYLGGDTVDEFKEGEMATTTFPNGYGHGPRTHKESVTLNTIDRPVVKQNLRIRKLLPIEAMKLMGFTEDDYKSLRAIGLGDSAIYHVAGDSIVTTVLMAILSQVIFDNDDHKQIIDDYTKKLLPKEDKTNVSSK